MVMHSFFGVCGLQSASEYTRLVALAQTILPSGRFLMAGVKVLDNSLNKIELSKLVQPFVHCDYDPEQSFESLVFNRIKKSKRYAQGLQLNCVPWMETDFTGLWKSIRRLHPSLRLMLQAHPGITECHRPREVARQLQKQCVDYIMFDASQSRRIPYDPTVMLEYISAIYALNLPIGVVVSGGLSPDTVRELFWPLVELYTDLSCDAFLGLQDVGTSSDN
jgi:hypothetical protein